jgi:hypothetical protein
MTPYEPSFTKELYRERLAKADADRLAQQVSRKREQPIRRARESRGVTGLLAWAEGAAIVRRAW